MLNFGLRGRLRMLVAVNVISLLMLGGMPCGVSERI